MSGCRVRNSSICSPIPRFCTCIHHQRRRVSHPSNLLHRGSSSSQLTCRSIQDAQANGYVASLLENAETMMGLLHAAYGMTMHNSILSRLISALLDSTGLGAFSAPFAATHFAQVRRWSFHYLLSVAIAVLNTILVAVVFRGRRQEGMPSNSMF